jgi:hypothetical protein
MKSNSGVADENHGLELRGTDVSEVTNTLLLQANAELGQMIIISCSGKNATMKFRRDVL